MILRVPVTASNMLEWVRRCADAVNQLAGRVTNLEIVTETPFTVDSVTFRPVTLPTGPTKGTTVYDISDDTVKTWNGIAWMPHY